METSQTVPAEIWHWRASLLGEREVDGDWRRETRAVEAMFVYRETGDAKRNTNRQDFPTSSG